MKTPLQLSDGALLNSLVFLAAEEKKCTAKVVLHLAEVDARKLFCELKYASLFDYCVGELGYSEAQAWRRVGALRLVKRSGAVREKIKRGNLSVTNAAMVGSFLREQPKLNVEELVEKVEGKSKRECEQFLNRLRGGERRPKRTLAKQSEGEVRLSVTLKGGTYKKLKKLLDLHAHKGWDLSSLIDHMAEAELVAMEKKKTAVKKKKSKQITSPGKSAAAKRKQVTSLGKFASTNSKQVTSPGKPAKSPQKNHSRYIKKSVRAQVWTEAGGRCQHCGSERALEFDHCKPFAWGGGSDAANLRLLCRECNRRQAVKTGLGRKNWKTCTLNMK